MKIIRLLVVLSGLIFLGSTTVSAFGGSDAVGVGSLAPDFSLQDVHGKTVRLADMQGKVVFLNFWATWCPPCRVEMPSMEMLNEVFASQGFVMLAVNVEPEGRETVPPFLKSNPHEFSVLLDYETKVQNAYGVYRFPETFLIDKQGRIARHYIGAYDWSSVEILKQIKELVDAE
ncbi:MAG: thioredoxin [Desulfuromonas sp.]|nr:MAG: thioredoxin [Desulfuromonas sp.]